MIVTHCSHGSISFVGDLVQFTLRDANKVLIEPLVLVNGQDAVLCSDASSESNSLEVR